MTDKTRFRIMGGVFLLAVLVIVLPMIFDGKGIARTKLAPLPQAAEVSELTSLERTPMDASELIDKVSELAAAVDKQGFRTDNGTRVGEPVLNEVQATTDVFAVQVASFADLTNAHEFRSRLRQDGYEAFVSTVRLTKPSNRDSDTLTRVAVGPFLDADTAQALRAELTKKYNMQARLMAFSS